MIILQSTRTLCIGHVYGVWGIESHMSHLHETEALLGKLDFLAGELFGLRHRISRVRLPRPMAAGRFCALESRCEGIRLTLSRKLIFGHMMHHEFTCTVSGSMDGDVARHKKAHVTEVQDE